MARPEITGKPLPSLVPKPTSRPAAMIYPDSVT